MSNQNNRPFKILSIDGGGILGLYSATVLTELEKKSGMKAGDCFDMICGTSTGGLIALGLATGKPASELAELYRNKGNRIFPTSNNGLIRFFQRKWLSLRQIGFFGKFNNKQLKAILTETFGITTLGELDNLVCVPSYNLTSGMPRMFKFPHAEGGFYMDRDVPIVDAALATSAAPTYLPIHEYKDTLFADGGVWANNPSLCGLLEALKYFINNDSDKGYSHVEILSIASISKAGGWTSGGRLRRSFAGWNSKLLQTFMDGQAFFTHFFLDTSIQKLNPNSKYVRVESPKLSPEHMKVLEMDRTDEKAIKTLTSLGHQDGVTCSLNPDVISFFQTTKTYKTQ